MDDIIPAGHYRARAKSWGLGETKKNKEQVAIEFALLDIPEHIGWYGYFTDKAQEITFRALRACGWIGVDLEDLSGLDANEVELVIEHEEYEGKTYARVKFVNQVGGGAMLKAPMDDAKKKIFAAKMKGALVAFDRSSGTPTTKKGRVGAVSPEPPPHSDGDMPF